MKIQIIPPFIFYLFYSICLSAQDIQEKDNFYLFVNKKWLDTTQTNLGTLGTISEITTKRLLFLLDKNSRIKHPDNNTPEKKLADFYTSGLDTITLEKKGQTVLHRYLKRIDAAANFEEFFLLVAELHREGQAHFLGISIEQDAKNKGFFALHLKQRPLPLGFASVYEAEGEIFDSIRKSYKHYVATVFKLIGKSEEESIAIADRVFDFDKQLAQSYMTDADLYNPSKTYNKIAINDLEKRTPQLPWSKLLDRMDIKTDSVIMINPNYVDKLHELTSRIALETWKNKLKINIILGRTIALNFSFREALVQLKSVFTGGKQYNPRGEELLSYCNNEILGKLYADEYFSKEKKEKIEGLVANLKKAFRIRLQKNTWMSKETKAKAIKKLDAMGSKIGYPERMNTYKDLEIDTTNFFENIDRWGAYTFKLNCERLHKENDRNLWNQVLPQEVNAYYDTDNNEIIFPAAILQAPLFDDHYNEASLYGAIGYIIGHELTHGFDKNGRLYDERGGLKNWWTENDVAKFDQRCKKLILQFNKIEVSKDIFVNGEQTLSENIADLGGLSIAFDAYKMSETGKANNTDGDKDFFYAFAKVWREKTNIDELIISVSRDTHAPAQWRVNTILSNFTPFYKTFDLNETDQMYLKKRERVEIW